MKYTAVIRTLGLAGDKYQRLLDSLIKQVLPPQKIVVYIAEGYSIPKETVNIEEYVFVKKGMVAQRALNYNEIDTEYILFLDDDLELPSDAVQKMFHHLLDAKADVISPDIMPNHDKPFLTRLTMTISGRMIGRRNDEEWGYKIMRNAGYSYNLSPRKDWLLSQTNAGACFLCKKDVFLGIQFDEERWMDCMAYAMGDDQVMYYKMFCRGYKQITWYNHNISHLDGGNNMSPIKARARVENDMFFKIVFWHRFMLRPEKKWLLKLWTTAFFIYTILFSLLSSLLRFDFQMLLAKMTAIKSASSFLRSDEYRSIPVIVKTV